MRVHRVWRYVPNRRGHCVIVSRVYIAKVQTLSFTLREERSYSPIAILRQQGKLPRSGHYQQR